MSHILMVTVGAHGHVNPHLPVLAELVERGHRVTIAVPESFAEVAASSGATPLIISSDLPDQSRGEQWPDGGVEAMDLFLAEGQGVLPQLETALASDAPDAVLYDIGGYAGRALAHRRDLPLLQLSPSMVAWQGYEEDMAEALAFLDTTEGAAYRRRFDRWLADLGIDCDGDTFTGRPPRCAVLIPKAMQPNADRVDESVYTFVGPALDRRKHQGGWPKPDRPLLLVSLGSAYTDRPDFYRACIEAFGGLDWQVVISIGQYVETSALGPVPSNIELHRWVPQLAVLEHASAFVTHAGMGGCSEGLYHGVPMVAVPQAVDQFLNAHRLTEIGVGVHLPASEVTAESLRQAVLSVADSAEVADALASCRAESRRAGGADAAADIVESML
ncbi:macrolide family glycosyltransferase [Saccharomonospora xinjiangensis]|uniref:Glycosyltransferase, MGT family n=1 Tax=Saccharomonospora xinjiangensis XJ-54 TaxID=882086 RepID=I0V4G0_9PSEU|nr:macrolide family glycosyltransferase [Saccharomonospora xinjiangensis]EID55013.1 glycosyltransferase, MGT family [Saccharomonospora xinjiangensis XJ-54]